MEGEEQELIVVPIPQTGDQVVCQVDGCQWEPAESKNAHDCSYHPVLKYTTIRKMIKLQEM
jgi:hypothetical protein